MEEKRKKSNLNNKSRGHLLLISYNFIFVVAEGRRYVTPEERTPPFTIPLPQRHVNPAAHHYRDYLSIMTIHQPAQAHRSLYWIHADQSRFHHCLLKIRKGGAFCPSGRRYLLRGTPSPPQRTIPVNLQECIVDDHASGIFHLKPIHLNLGLRGALTARHHD